MVWALRLYYFRRYEHLFATSWPRCKSCSGIAFSPILVTPMPVKVFGKPLQKAWELAGEKLRKADKLVIIGYSIPANDRKARELIIRNFVVENLDPQDRPEVSIVNPDRCVREMIKDLLQPSVQGVTECERFEDYCSTALVDD